MYILQITDSFSAAHYLRNYKGKCEKLHGHNFKVEIKVKGSKLDKKGMLIDFQDIKKMTRKILSGLDHSNLNEKNPFTKTNPTSENIAKYLFEEINKKLSFFNCILLSITVWENEKASATYEKD